MMLQHIWLRWFRLSMGIMALGSFFVQCSDDESANMAYIGVISVNNELDTDVHLFRMMHKARRPDIKGILMLVDAAGGNAGKWDLFREEVEYLRSLKPVVVVVTGNCFSGAYLVAAAADYIVAPSIASIGSIGCFLKVDHFENVEYRDEALMAHLTTEYFAAGKFKTTGFPDRHGLSLEERAYIEDQVRKHYDIFCKHISRLRSLPIDQKHCWADGKDFNGEESLAIGLIDELGGISLGLERLIGIIHERGVPDEYFDLIELSEEDEDKDA